MSPLLEDLGVSLYFTKQIKSMEATELSTTDYIS